MCGIAGILGKEATETTIRKMIGCQTHRGPDDSGFLYQPENNIALGQNRLSIIDLSSAGHQPMASSDQRYWIVYNGEVYNYLPIREELLKKGYKFHSATDTEVILYSYIEWGPACLNKFRGMYAFAIWDSRDKKIFLARDRFGIKPLFYSVKQGQFVFASEVDTMLNSGQVSREADLQSICDYISTGAMIQPRTILKEVTSLLPGHYMVYEHGKISIERYWDLYDSTRSLTKTNSKITYEDAVKEVRNKLFESARLHMIADVSVGAFLSGGIDSTAAVALMSNLSNKKIKTYSIGFDDGHPELNESKWAALAAERIGADHTGVLVTAQDLLKEYDSLIQSIDQPCSDGTNTYFVSKAAREGVTVALSGLGGDEIFAGYGHYKKLKVMAGILPHGLKSPFGGMLKTMANVLPQKYKMALHNLADSPVSRVASQRLLFPGKNIEQILSGKVIRSGFKNIEEQYAHLYHESLDAVKNISYIELNSYIRDTLLRDNDIFSMRWSIETRPLLLDHELAEFVFSLPSDIVMRKVNYNKPLFVDAVKDLLPDEIIHRKKMGFVFPLNVWLKTVLKDKAQEQFESAVAKEIFHPEFRKYCLQELDNKSSSLHLWSLFMLLSYLNSRKLEILS